MNTPNPVPVRSLAARSSFARRAGISAAVILALGAVEAKAATWTNATVTPTPGAGQAWSLAANWGGTLPAAGGTVAIYRTGNLAASVLLDTVTNAVYTTNVDYGSNLLIASGGEFTVGASGGALQLGAHTASTINVQSGGKITGGTGAFTIANASTLDTAGSIGYNYLQLSGASTVKMTGGSIVTQQTFNGIQVTGQSVFNQSGGTLTTSNIQINQGNYVVSGGTITTSTANGLYFIGATTTAGSAFTVKGSAATLNFSGFRNDDTGAGIVRPTFAFTLDNTAGHISTINLTANGTHGTTLRANANLSVSLAGGVLLSGAQTFTIIQRVSGTDTAWANNTSLTGLWKDVTATSGTKAAIQIGFKPSTKGTLDVLGTTPLTFIPASLGFINLTNTGSLTSMQLGLDITGGTLSNFTNALTGSGIGWTAGVGAYDVIITLNPSVSGGTYFAWDFTNIDAAMQLQGISAIPEPASFVMLAGLGVLGFVSLRRRRRSQA